MGWTVNTCKALRSARVCAWSYCHSCTFEGRDSHGAGAAPGRRPGKLLTEPPGEPWRTPPAPAWEKTEPWKGGTAAAQDPSPRWRVATSLGSGGPPSRSLPPPGLLSAGLVDKPVMVPTSPGARLP